MHPNNSFPLFTSSLHLLPPLLSLAYVHQLLSPRAGAAPLTIPPMSSFLPAANPHINPCQPAHWCSSLSAFVDGPLSSFWTPRCSLSEAGHPVVVHNPFSILNLVQSFISSKANYSSPEGRAQGHRGNSQSLKREKTIFIVNCQTALPEHCWSSVWSYLVGLERFSRQHDQFDLPFCKRFAPSWLFY